MDMTPELPPALQERLSGGKPTVMGPQMPPHLQKRLEVQSSSSDEDECFGAPLPPHLVNSKKSSRPPSQDEDLFGPELPPHLLNLKKKSSTENFNSKKDSESEEGEIEDDYGPALPPHLIKRGEVMGPSRPPPGYEAPIVVDSSESSSSDSEVYGPLPPTHTVDMDHYLRDKFRQREEKLSRRQEEADAPKGRESWMLELPEDKPLFEALGGLKGINRPRVFAKKSKEEKGDTSEWTDTPEEKERKKLGLKDEKTKKKMTSEEHIQSRAARKRDKEQQKIVDRHNEKKRSKTLLDQHMLDKKKAQAEGKLDGDLSLTGSGCMRKPFSRDEDMSVNKFDEVQKRKMIEQAKMLGDRFSSSKKSKYL